MKHTLLAGLAALITATTVSGAEPKSSAPIPGTSRAVRPQELGREFITNAKFGIFVHYTVEYAHLLGKPEPAVWDLDAKADAFDVKAFADAVEGMGAQYVTLTAFHAAMYLLAPGKILQLEQKSNPWEVVATDSADGSTVYVHVMIPPAGQTIHLPPLNDGRKIITASLLLGGKEVKFKQAEEALELSLPENVKWDPVDTVIALKVGPAFGVK